MKPFFSFVLLFCAGLFGVIAEDLSRLDIYTASAYGSEDNSIVFPVSESAICFLSYLSDGFDAYLTDNANGSSSPVEIQSTYNFTGIRGMSTFQLTSGETVVWFVGKTSLSENIYCIKYDSDLGLLNVSDIYYDNPSSGNILKYSIVRRESESFLVYYIKDGILGCTEAGYDLSVLGRVQVSGSGEEVLDYLVSSKYENDSFKTPGLYLASGTPNSLYYFSISGQTIETQYSFDSTDAEDLSFCRSTFHSDMDELYFYAANSKLKVLQNTADGYETAEVTDFTDYNIEIFPVPTESNMLLLCVKSDAEGSSVNLFSFSDLQNINSSNLYNTAETTVAVSVIYKSLQEVELLLLEKNSDGSPVLTAVSYYAATDFTDTARNIVLPDGTEYLYSPLYSFGGRILLVSGTETFVTCIAGFPDWATDSIVSEAELIIENINSSEACVDFVSDLRGVTFLRLSDFLFLWNEIDDNWNSASGLTETSYPSEKDLLIFEDEDGGLCIYRRIN